MKLRDFFLGFELLAEHNIAHVFECLQPAECSREELLETPYFQEHFKVEPEHIKRAITMGMGSCNSESPEFQVNAGYFSLRYLILE